MLSSHYQPCKKWLWSYYLFYHEFGEQCVKMLDGIFGFILYDQRQNEKDSKRPRYYSPKGFSSDNELYVSSEMKS